MWHCVDFVSTDVSEEIIASIFRVENPLAVNQREQVAADWATSRSTQALHSATSQKTVFFFI
jgi:hypothetical protein